MPEVAADILCRFVPADSIPERWCAGSADDAYATFDLPDVAPLTRLDDRRILLELFHGPTLAFKDVAMQVLARLYEHGLREGGRELTIVCATSGDTGGAAVEAFAGREHIRVVALYPEGRISEVQRRFMTTSSHANVRAVAVAGDFDDCQALLKGLFRDEAFVGEIGLSLVNSINIARVIAQIVYYFTSAVALGAPARPVSFAVPTGNFGDAYAGWAARRMGLPIRRIVVATNVNDIVARALETGVYRRGVAVATQSPSMDIQVASNFERLVYDCLNGDAGATVRGVRGLRGARRDRPCPRSARQDARGVPRRRHRRGGDRRRHGARQDSVRRDDRPAHRRRPGRRRGSRGGDRRDDRRPRHRPSGEVPGRRQDSHRRLSGPARRRGRARGPARTRRPPPGRRGGAENLPASLREGGSLTAPGVHTLGNGVTVICDPEPGYQTLALSVVAGRGSRSEDAARSGWSHLLEHMVFKGAGSRSARDIVEVIEAEGGNINAATGHERTSFQVRALAGGLPLAMAVTADIVQRPTLDAGDLAREKLVVAQEIAEATDTPDDQVFELAQTAAFRDQPLGRPILGSAASLEPADPGSLEAWRAALYAPDRLVISAAGAIDEDDLLALAESLFGAAAPSAEAATPAPAVFVGGAAMERRRLEQAHVVFLLPAPAATDPASWTIRVFAEMLGGGMSSRLFQEARERLGLAYAIDAYAEAYSDTGLLGVYAGCDAANAGRLAEVVAREIRALTRDVGQGELARAKAQLKASLFMGRESLAGRAEQSAAQHLVFGRLLDPAEMARRIDAVNGADIAAAGAALLTPGASVVSVLGPKAALTAPSVFAEALFA